MKEREGSPQAQVADGEVTLHFAHAESGLMVTKKSGYAVDPERCHLYNRDGLPASPYCSRPELLRYEP